MLCMKKMNKKESCSADNKDLAFTIGYINLWSSNIKREPYQDCTKRASFCHHQIDRQPSGFNKTFTLNLSYKMILTSAETVSVHLHKTNLQKRHMKCCIIPQAPYQNICFNFFNMLMVLGRRQDRRSKSFNYPPEVLLTRLGLNKRTSSSRCRIFICNIFSCSPTAVIFALSIRFSVTVWLDVVLWHLLWSQWIICFLRPKILVEFGEAATPEWPWLVTKRVPTEESQYPDYSYGFKMSSSWKNAFRIFNCNLTWVSV